MKFEKFIRENYIKENLVLVVAEDFEFLKKLKNDFNMSPDLIIIYKGRRIVEIKVTRKSILTILTRPKVVISEYFNAIPRIIGFLLKAQTLSIIYGVLNTQNFKHRRIFLKKLREPLFADTYLVVNRQSTFDTLYSIHNKKVKFIEIKRKIDKGKGNGNYNLWISQCWEEIGFHEIEKLQQKCLRKLENHSKIIIVKHPREVERKYSQFEASIIISNLSGIFDYINSNGNPSMVYGLTSSALLELDDYSLPVTRVNHKLVEEISIANKDLLKLNTIPFNEL